MRRPPKVDWNAQPLGELPDNVLAKQLGVATVTVFRARCKRGIPPFCTGPVQAGQRFGALVTGRLVGGSDWPEWVCTCDCGVTVTVLQTRLCSGSTISCGCKGDTQQDVKWHIQTRSPEWRTWVGMIKRCTDPTAHSYALYGGRGIHISERWLEFENFLSDMGSRPSQTYSIDRIDNDGDYAPENCRWATSLQQANNRRCNRRVEINGEVKTIAEWARELGVDYSLLYAGVRAEPIPRLGIQHVRSIVQRDLRNKELRAINWAAQPLGQMTDRALGERLGVSHETVRYERAARGIPPVDKQRVLAGQKFGRLLTLSRIVVQDVGKHSRTHWRCRCECGVEKLIREDSLLGGAIRSCGCLQKEAVRLTGYNNRNKPKVRRLFRTTVRVNLLRGTQ